MSDTRPLLYFLPGRVGPLINPAEARVLELSYVFGDDNAAGRGGVGPSNDGPPVNGVIAARKGAVGESDLSYRPDEQQWTECDGGRFWVGFFSNRRPLPEDLAREDAKGLPVRMCDGRDWVVPILSSLVQRPPSLPMMQKLDSAGNFIQSLNGKYSDLQARAQKIAEAFVEQIRGGEPTITILEAEAFAIVCDAIALNYRVSKWEASALEIIDTSSSSKAIDAILDWDECLRVGRLLQDEQKKTSQLDTSNTDSGSKDSTSPTDQPSLILAG